MSAEDATWPGPRRSRVVVGPQHTVPRLLPDSALSRLGQPVLATGVLIALLEAATWEAIEPLPPGAALVGAAGRYEHQAPSLPGHVLEIEVVCTAPGRRSQWSSRASNLTTGREVMLLQHEVVRCDQARLRRRLRAADAGESPAAAC